MDSINSSKLQNIPVTNDPGIDSWPPWPETKHVRKGRFCHSSAAIGVYKVKEKAAAVSAGLKCRIRSIDVVHQQPDTTGEISHWWVCVNRPDEVRFDGGINKFERFSHISYLPLLGGFVIDIWGALWKDQEKTAEARFTSSAETAGTCVANGPFILLGALDARVKFYLHHLLP